jgi:hypothetical protein
MKPFAGFPGFSGWAGFALLANAPFNLNSRHEILPELSHIGPQLKLAAATRNQVASAEGETRTTPASFTEESPDEPSAADDAAPLTSVAAAEEPASKSDRYAPGSIARVGLVGRSATRPQPVGQPEQRVLEWERAGALDARLLAGTVLR